MADDKGLEIVRVFDVCNKALRASIKCAEEGRKPCETCKLLNECKKLKNELDKLWSEKS